MRQTFKKILVSILTLIAKGILKRHDPTVIAITGSVGKTSTKDAIYEVLRREGSVRRSEKSFNSELGVPLSIIGAKNAWGSVFGWLSVIMHGLGQLLMAKGKFPKTLVLEVGADRPGDISTIAKWLKPHVVVITRLPDVPVHIEFFPTVESLIEEKISLAKNARKDATLVLNVDDPHIRAAKEKLPFKSVTFGTGGQHTTLVASNVQVLAAGPTSPGGLTFKLDFDGNIETSYAAQSAGNSFCEPVFAPRPGSSDEDDGWLLSVEYRADEHRSRLVILDAKDIASGPVAIAQLKHHVPQGFHGNFVA